MLTEVAIGVLAIVTNTVVFVLIWRRASRVLHAIHILAEWQSESLGDIRSYAKRMLDMIEIEDDEEAYGKGKKRRHRA